ncbi:MAG TPA: NUDIX hydrolase [Ignavibacteriales bacterium]|nr:NUDIX hydrolase [Ignavibacteriales bacterium]
MPLRRWNKISQRTVIKNDHWSYRLDEFEIEGGSRGEYHYVHTGGSSMVIPVKDDGSILLVNQFRYLNQKESLEFPCGSVEEGLTPEENAIKELREETGFTALRLEKAGEFSPYTGASDEICTVFVARGLSPAPLRADVTEEFELVEKTYSEIESLIESNFIWDGLSLAAWLLAKKHLK